MTRSHHFALITAVAVSLMSIQLLTATTAENESARQDPSQRPLPPEIIIFPESLHVTLEQGQEISCFLNITNGGNEELRFDCKLKLLRFNDEEIYQAQPWELLQRWNVTDSIKYKHGDGDYKINGICLIRDRWYVVGDNGNNQNYFYIFNRIGELIDTLSQPIAGRYGYSDITNYNDLLYCISSDYRFIHEVDPVSGELQKQYQYNDIPPIYLPNIAVDSNTGYFYISGITTCIYMMEIINDSLLVTQLFRPHDPRDNDGIIMRGLAWFPQDPDGYPLYVISDRNFNRNDESPDISLYKINPDDRSIVYISQLQDIEPHYQGRGGICITTDTFNWNWMFAAILDSPTGVEAVIYNLGPNLRWINLDPETDTLRPAGDIDMFLDITSEELLIGNYELTIELFCNAQTDSIVIPLTIEVTPNEDFIENKDETLADNRFTLFVNYPNPFNSTTNIIYDIPHSGVVRLTAFDIAGREIGVLVDGKVPAGRYSIPFDAGQLPAGIYFYRLEAGGMQTTKKMVLVR